MADAIEELPADGIRRVAVDGADGAGKTYFADELATEPRSRGIGVVRAAADGFHHPAAIRHRRGRRSPDGYYRDSYDYSSLRRLLLDPLSPGGSRVYVREIYDVHTEREVRSAPEHAEPGGIQVFDGIFAHRRELRDYSIWLDVPFTGTARVGHSRRPCRPFA